MIIIALQYRRVRHVVDASSNEGLKRRRQRAGRERSREARRVYNSFSDRKLVMSSAGRGPLKVERMVVICPTI